MHTEMAALSHIHFIHFMQTMPNYTLINLLLFKHLCTISNSLLKTKARLFDSHDSNLAHPNN